MAFVAGYNGEIKLDNAVGGALTSYKAYARSVSTNLPINLGDTTVFGDTQNTRLPLLKDFNFSVEFIPDSAGVLSAVLNSHVQSSASISFEIDPEGTAVGSQKITGECYLESLTPGATVDGLATLTASYQGTGATTLGTN